MFQGLNGCYRVCYRVLSGTIGYYRVLSGIMGTSTRGKVAFLFESSLT